MKKKIAILLSCLLIAGFATYAWANNITPKDSKSRPVKVYIGSSKHQPLQKYKENRSQVLQNIAIENKDQTIDALVVFNKFLLADQVLEVIGKDIDCKEIWLANPGVRGIGNAIVEDNNIEAAKERFYSSFAEFAERHLNDDNKDDTIDENYKAVKSNEFKVYAVLVSGKVDNLTKLTNENISIVDPHYWPEASKSQAKVSFIDVPSRPDGIK